jgi:hypothetical protein
LARSTKITWQGLIGWFHSKNLLLPHDSFHADLNQDSKN